VRNRLIPTKRGRRNQGTPGTKSGRLDDDRVEVAWQVIEGEQPVIEERVTDRQPDIAHVEHRSPAQQVVPGVDREKRKTADHHAREHR